MLDLRKAYECLFYCIYCSRNRRVKLRQLDLFLRYWRCFASHPKVLLLFWAFWMRDEASLRSQEQVQLPETKPSTSRWPGWTTAFPDSWKWFCHNIMRTSNSNDPFVHNPEMFRRSSNSEETFLWASKLFLDKLCPYLLVLGHMDAAQWIPPPETPHLSGSRRCQNGVGHLQAGEWAAWLCVNSLSSRLLLWHRDPLTLLRSCASPESPIWTAGRRGCWVTT